MNEPDYLDLIIEEAEERHDAELELERTAKRDVALESKLAREPRWMAANRSDHR